MKKYIILMALSAFVLNTNAQQNKELVDTLKKVYAEKSIMLTQFGYYVKNNEWHRNGLFYANLGKEFQISKDAMYSYERSRNTAIIGSGLLIGAGYMFYRFIYNAISNVGTQSYYYKMVGGEVALILGASISFSISNFQLNKAVNYYNRDIMLNFVGKY